MEAAITAAGHTAPTMAQRTNAAQAARNTVHIMAQRTQMEKCTAINTKKYFEMKKQPFDSQKRTAAFYLS